MTYLLTTNQNTLGHGDSPLKHKPIHRSFRRGFIIYITLTPNGLMSRQFYCNFNRTGIASQYLFENILLRAGATIFDERDLRLPHHRRGQYPKVFEKNMNIVNFGWRPCKVTYILDRTPFKFIDIPNNQDENGPTQPVIFRRDKFIDGTIQQFEANHSFYNLQTETVGDISYLRFDNFMLKADGSSLPRQPSSTSDWENHRQKYCTDIYVELDQQRFGLSADPGIVIAGQSAESIIADTNPPLVTIFDPLQDNGGLGGPPN